MALRTILEDGDPALRKVCRPVEKFNDRLFTLLDDMRDTLIEANGAGLAGPQVGVLRRLVLVYDTATDSFVEMINPEITAVDGEQCGEEGCLSLPGRWGIVKRPMHVVAKYQDRNGKWQTIEGTELTARAICHELDHLNGVLYTDVAERMLTEEEMQALERRKGDA